MGHVDHGKTSLLDKIEMQTLLPEKRGYHATHWLLLYLPLKMVN